MKTLKPMRYLIKTFSNIEIDLEDIKPEQVLIEDIAHSLSLQCRYAGQTRNFYSVAEHSLNLALMVPPLFRNYTLLQNAYEAYFNCISHPLKNIITENWPGFNELIRKANKTIVTALQLDFKKFYYVREVIKDTEIALYNMECSVLFGDKSKLAEYKLNHLEDNHPLKSATFDMVPDEAEKNFLSIYNLLKN